MLTHVDLQSFTFPQQRQDPQGYPAVQSATLNTLSHEEGAQHQHADVLTS